MESGVEGQFYCSSKYSRMLLAEDEFIKIRG